MCSPPVLVLLLVPSYYYHDYHQLDPKYMGLRQHVLTLLLWLLTTVECKFGLSTLSVEQHLPEAEVICAVLLRADCGHVDTLVPLQNNTPRRLC